MSKKLIAFITTVVVMLAVASPATAQRINVKTNALYWLAMSPNLGVEFRINRHMTFNLEGVVNRVSGFKPYGVSNLSTKGFAFEPEARYWFCNKFMGHFIGIHAHGGQFNMGGLDLDFKFLGTNYRNLRDHRYEGWFAGGGIAYGYAWTLGRHWNMEAELGIGYSYSGYDKYPCEKCGKKVESDGNHHYYGITKAALSLVYVF